MIDNTIYDTKTSQLQNPLWQGRPRPCGKAEAALLHRAHVVLQLPLIIVAVILCGMAVEAMDMCPSFAPKAVQEYRRRADAGDAEAQYLYAEALRCGLGVAKDLSMSMKYAAKAAKQRYGASYLQIAEGYASGYGVESNAVKAAKWHAKHFEWAKAEANNGDAFAQYALGGSFLNGRGVEKNEKEAVKWFRKAAEQGLSWAQRDLGCMYRGGCCVAKDGKEAVKWLRMAAEQGDAFAQLSLANVLDYGDEWGMEADKVEALKWYRKSAAQEDPCAQYMLGCAYEYGSGVEKNNAEALKWYRKAAGQGFAYAEEGLKRLQAKEGKSR